jgi:NitT/TauT family transport system substrate-binding protein
MTASSESLADTLRIYGNLSLLEMAPVLLAAEHIYAGKTLVEHGSVMALWGKSSDLASLNSAGQADLATNSETQALRGSVAGPDLRFIFTVAECPYRIVARRSAGIAKLADLRCKRVATQLDSSAAYFLDSMLRTAGLTSEDVTSVPFMAHTETPLSLVVAQTGKLDIDTVSGAWPRFKYPGTLATDLLDVFERQDVWIAKVQGRPPRTREALAKLIDDSVLREALAL